MKTTLNIDDTAMAELRQEAARQGRTMSELVETALRNLFRSQKQPVDLAPLPVFHGGGALVDIADRDALSQAMEGRQRLPLVDASILVHAADADSPWHASARARIERQRRVPDAWYVAWPILYEFLRVTTHPRVMRRPWSATQAWGFVAALLASPGLGVLSPTPRHADVAAQVIREHPRLAGNRFHDAHTVVLMHEHGVRRICTRDTDFHRFANLEVVDPL